MTIQPFVVDIELEGLPESGFFTDETMCGQQGPTWSTRNVSMTFFGRSQHWLRQHVSEGHLLLDGVPMLLPRAMSDDRPRWRLYDIERAAHALAQGGYLDTAQLVRTITLVKLIAETWGFIDSQGGSLLTIRGEYRSRYPEIRRWASEHGHYVGRRGRIPMPVVAAWVRAQQKKAKPRRKR